MNIRDILSDGERVTLECKKATKGVPKLYGARVEDDAP